MKEKSWSEFSDKFYKEHPELYDSVPINVEATVKFSFVTGSHLNDEELIERAIKELRAGPEIQIVLKVLGGVAE